MKKPKIPFNAIEGVKNSKSPRFSPYVSNDENFPDFRTGKMDIGGRWGWHSSNILSIDMREFLEKIFQHQKLSWQEIKNRSHNVQINQLIHEARKRLETI